ncbi:16S rRNA (guanine(966)-N(2))-methyltransferase RsmD [Aquilutibacter rugosus]|uniref:16S rRNA (guanine(966)-N(2))-methyltransferase RsmD n=1 Tax=Aquilutibacter rugosus TaxID=3115820 RepID=UPI002F415B3E
MNRNASRAPRAQTATGQVRIIGGEWGGRKLPVLNKPGLRPTSDRVRETLFNWIQFQIAGMRVLDPFAGTGALGLEALSRGAVHTTFCELDSDAARQLQVNIETLGAQDRSDLRRTDGVQCLRSLAGQSERFDLIFLDPPFGLNLHEPALQAVDHITGAGSWLYLEQELRGGARPSALWQEHRQGQTREVHYALYRRSK